MRFKFQVEGPHFRMDGRFGADDSTMIEIDLQEVTAEDAPAAFSSTGRVGCSFRALNGRLWKLLSPSQGDGMIKGAMARQLGVQQISDHYKQAWAGSPTDSGIEAWRGQIAAAVIGNVALIEGVVYQASSPPRLALTIQKHAMLDIDVAFADDVEKVGTTYFSPNALPALLEFRQSLRGARKELREPPAIDVCFPELFAQDELADFATQTKAWVCSHLAELSFGTLPADAIRAYVGLRRAGTPDKILPEVMRLANAIGYHSGYRLQPWKDRHYGGEQEQETRLLEALALPCKRIEFFYASVGNMQDIDSSALI